MLATSFGPKMTSQIVSSYISSYALLQRHNHIRCPRGASFFQNEGVWVKKRGDQTHRLWRVFIITDLNYNKKYFKHSTLGFCVLPSGWLSSGLLDSKDRTSPSVSAMGRDSTTHWSLGSSDLRETARVKEQIDVSFRFDSFATSIDKTVDTHDFPSTNTFPVIEIVLPTHLSSASSLQVLQAVPQRAVWVHPLLPQHHL